MVQLTAGLLSRSTTSVIGLRYPHCCRVRLTSYRSAGCLMPETRSGRRGLSAVDVRLPLVIGIKYLGIATSNSEHHGQTRHPNFQCYRLLCSTPIPAKSVPSSLY
jgi:hypothetical protein